jgi:hypothetical protein
MQRLLKAAQAKKLDRIAAALNELAGVTAAKALEQAGRIPNPHVRAELIGRLVESALDAGHFPNSSFADSIERMRAAVPGELEVSAYASALEGRVLLAEGDRTRARAAAEQAIMLESQRALPARLADWYLLLANIVPEERAQYARAAYLALSSEKLTL